MDLGKPMYAGQKMCIDSEGGLKVGAMAVLFCIFGGILQQWLDLGGLETQFMLGKNLRLDLDWLDGNKIKITNLSFGGCINYFSWCNPAYYSIFWVIPYWA